SYGVAITFGPFLCSSLLTQFNYMQIFQIISIIPIIGLLPFFVGIEFTLFDETKENTAPIAGLFSYIAHSKNLIILTVLRLLFALGYGFFATYFIIHAEKTILLAPFLIAFLMGIRGAVDMVLRIPVGHLVDRIDTKYFIFAGFSILAFVYQLLAITSDFYILVILMILFGVALGLRVVSEWTMVANESPEGHRNVVAAYLSTMFNIGSGFGAVLGGFLATFMIIPDLFRIASGLMIIGMIIVLFIKKKEKKSLAIPASEHGSMEE
ncbi:MAG: MFS transporter, partial [Candidatus Thorarchaeota archaeon]|nr:MFS transporter [Candidatus Thorarchaeota archaeon]